MKKFFALFAMIACFGMMNSNAQTVKALAVANGEKLYLLDSLAFNNLDRTKAYDFGIYMMINNNSAADFVIGDTIQVEFKLNEIQPMGLSLTITGKDWKVDSSMLISLKGISIPATALKEGNFANEVCAKVTKVYTNSAYKEVSDEGFCGHFTTTFANVSVAESEMAAINVYPNPVRNSLTIENANNVNVNIYAANGQMVKTFVANGTTTINMNDLSNGLYIVKMQGENATRVEKVQVIR